MGLQTYAFGADRGEWVYGPTRNTRLQKTWRWVLGPSTAAPIADTWH